MAGATTKANRTLPGTGHRAAISPMARLRRSLLGIPAERVQPELRGFAVLQDARRARVIRIGESFLHGYHAALLDPRPEPLARTLAEGVEPGWRGFAFEGAAMALAIQDSLFPRLGRPSRVQEMAAGPGFSHRYLVLVGAGWAFARLPRRFGRALSGIDPVLRWLAFDGYGFHHGYFGWRRSIERRRVPRRLRGYARRAFDQGLGRSLWFVRGMDPAGIASTIETFPAHRRGDLWSGVGLASAFAGGLTDGELRELRRLAGTAVPHVAQGVAFAAKARLETGEPTPWLVSAATVLVGASPAELAALTDRMRAELPDDGADLTADDPAFEVWRRRIRQALAGGTGEEGAA